MMLHADMSTASLVTNSKGKHAENAENIGCDVRFDVTKWLSEIQQTPTQRLWKDKTAGYRRISDLIWSCC